ncbi:MAG: ATP-binding protein [Patescibacteria group bacterium]|nr:ATP-binding protein [Patescibacteria group bacterium]
MASVVPEIVSRRDVAEGGVVVNSVVKNLTSLARKAYQGQCIVAYSSRTGVGKSKAVDHLAATLNFPSRIVRCKQTTSLTSLVRAIALDEDFRVNRSHHAIPNTAILYERAVERAWASRYLLVIDEADRLKANCFEMVRDLWDDAKIGILMVGNEGLESIINERHERLARRIRIRYVQSDLRRDALREVLEAMGFEFSDEELVLIYEKAGGSPGWAESLLNTRDEIAESHGKKPDIEFLRGALQYFPTLAKKGSR